MFTELIYQHLKDIYQTKVDSLTSPAVIINSSDTVSQVIHKISKNGIYDVFCLESGSVLTTNVRTLLAGKDIEDMKVGPFLYPIRFLSPGDTIQKAANILAYQRIRAVPFVENNQLVGNVTAKRILELLSSKDNKWITANLIFTRNPITIKSTESLSAARSLMLGKRIDHLPVIHKDKVRQVLTSFHLLQSLKPQQGLGRKSRGINRIKKLGSRVSNIGSTRIPECSPNDNLNTIIQLMLGTDTTCCLVKLWDRLHGIITYHDILSLLAAKIESEIPLYVVGMPDDQRNVDIITSKFTKTLKKLKKVYSEIQLARVTIKRQRSRGQRQYYEVSVRIITPYRTFAHKEYGWDLSQVLGYLSERLLRQLSKRSKRRFKMSIRKIESPSLLESV